MNISSILRVHSVEHIAGYRPVSNIGEAAAASIKAKLIEFKVLSRDARPTTSESPRKSPGKPKRAKGTKRAKAREDGKDFLAGFLSPEAKGRYSTEPKKRKDHSGKMSGQSDLTRMGYTTGQSQHARRIILKRAVPSLGLKKVVDIIVMNVKRSKTRMNPAVNAINRWESDLEWLKKNFWKQQFKWPNYRRFGR